MKEKSNLKSKKICSIFLLLGLIALVSGITYAFWYDSFFTDNNSITSGLVSMSYTESSNIITIGNALPTTDNNGMIQTNYFDFSVTSNMSLNSNDPSTDVDYEIILEPMSVDSGYTALTNSQIKVYLENKDTNSSLVNPTLISTLTDTSTNKILLSTKHTHSYGTNSITTNYRLRAWIDMNVDSSSWTDFTNYEYKFRININGEVDAIEQGFDPLSCFKFVLDETSENGLEIVDYLCGEDSTSQTSTSLDNNSLNTMPNYIDGNVSSKKLTNEVITDVVIPSTVTMSLTTIMPQEYLEDSDREECATFLTENIGHSGDYQHYYEICSGENDGSEEANLGTYYAILDELEEYCPGISNLKVFQTMTLPEATYSVTSIGTTAFSEKNLTSVVIPNTITVIGKNAFNDNNLTSITIPNSVTTIGVRAFSENNLTSITIPNSVKVIKDGAFVGNDLNYVVINSGSNLTEETGIESDVFRIGTYGGKPSNQNLTTIYNNSGKAFRWNSVLRNYGSSYDAFVTDTVTTDYGTVTITTGNPS